MEWGLGGGGSNAPLSVIKAMGGGGGGEVYVKIINYLYNKTL